MRQLIICLMSVALFSLFLSCQKEISVEYGTPAKGSLQGSAGNCLPKLVAGSYIANKAINDSNFIEVTVNVTSPGPYTIFTDTANGYSFKATGTFANTGTNTVRLKGSGLPIDPGTDDFMVVFDSSICYIDVTVLPSGSTGGQAVFTLDGAPGGCAAFGLVGDYYKDTTLDARHKVSVNVNVTTVGTYTITTNTQNGYFFSTTGTFGATGPQAVPLNGNGKPLAVGTNNFTVTAGTATCTFQVTVGTPATSGNCTATFAGTYTAGTPTTTANKVTLTHTYATAGTYNVTTNTVNGYSFGLSNFTANAGANSVVITATGTPSTAGTNTFTVNFGDGQTCTFTITVSSGTTPPVNTDYFPLTPNSYWTYSFPSPTSPSDTIKKVNNNTANAPNGSVYRDFEVFDNAGASAYNEYFRRSGNDYFEYTAADIYSEFTFDDNIEGDILFLKEGLTLNQVWTSAEFTGNVNGAPQKLRYSFKCIDPNATATINGKTYTNVYKVTMQPEVSTNGGTSWTADPLSWESWYARGIGMIQQKVTRGANSFTSSLRFYRIF